MTPVHSIAVAQTCPRAGDVNANLEEHLRLARLAAGEGARIVVFPELSLTGYELELAKVLAFSEDDARLLPLRDAAASHSAILIVGAPVRVGSRLHVGAFILHPNHASELYTKHYLGAFSASANCDGTVPPAEATVFQGAGVAVVSDTGHGPRTSIAML
jgi:predicted amidohydrolase